MNTFFAALFAVLVAVLWAFDETAAILAVSTNTFFALTMTFDQDDKLREARSRIAQLELRTRAEVIR